MTFNLGGFYPTLDDVDVAEKRVLLRVDYNIAATDTGALADDWRIRATLPTLNRLLQNGARVGILSHRGRPQGRVVPALSLSPVARRLSELLGKPVEFVPDCIGRVAEQAMARLKPGHAVMFENTRFHLGDQLNQKPFTQKLALLADVFVNDAFATTHRAHASTSGLAAAVEKSVIGDLMVQELRWMDRVMNNPKRPLTLILGGNDVAPRMELIGNILTRVDTLMLGGTVGLTFLAGRDIGLGQSLIDHGCIELSRELLAEAGVVGCRLHLPKDVVVADKRKLHEVLAIRDVHEIGDDEVASDLGPDTLSLWSRLIDEARTVIWIGSMGNYHHAVFRQAAHLIGEKLATKTDFSLVGGNGLVQTLAESGLRERLPAVSTGVGALLTVLMGLPLPALTVLQIRKEGAWNGQERRRLDFSEGASGA